MITKIKFKGFNFIYFVLRLFNVEYKIIEISSCFIISAYVVYLKFRENGNY